MKRLLLIAMVLCSSLVAADRRSIMRTYKAASSSGLLIDENFEGTGTPASWATSVGSPDFDNTVLPLSDAQDLVQGSLANCNSYCTFTGSPELWIQFEFSYTTSPSADAVWLYVFDVSLATSYTYLALTSGSGLKVGDSGGTSTATTDAMPNATKLWVFWHIVKGTGANAVYEVEFATTSTRTGTGNKFKSKTDGNLNLNGASFINNRDNTEWGSGNTWKIDNVKISNIGWPPP